MRKLWLIIMISILILTLVGCQSETDPEILALQSQYDDYRMNGFGDIDQFIDFVNTFSLQTMHAGVYITVETRLIGQESTIKSAYGIIIHEDTTYYYAVTDSQIMGDSLLRQTIKVYDVFELTSIGDVVTTDDITGLALVRFLKPSNPLYVATPATAIPFQNEPLVLLSQLNDIRSQITFGYMGDNEISYDFLTNNSLGEGILGGGVFDVNQRLVGLILTSDGTSLIMYDIVYELLSDVIS